MKSIFDSVGGRKFAFVIFCVLLCAILLACKLMGEANYTMIVLGCVSSYIAGNVAQDIFSKTKEGETDGISTQSDKSAE